MAFLSDIQESMKARRRTEAVEKIRHAIEKKSPLKTHWLMLAKMSLGLREVTLATECVDIMRQQTQRTVTSDIQRAGLYAEAGYLQRALATAEPLTLQQPDNPSIMHLCGTARAQLGDFSLADRYLRKVVGLAPHLGISWLTLASFTDFSEDIELFQELLDVADKYSEDDPINWMHYHYALGKALTDRDRLEDAVKAYEKGAKLMAQQSKYKAAFDKRFVTDLQTYFSKQGMKAVPESRVKYNRAIAILGLPRSGTTLLGQILSNHSAVVGAGETGAFGQACAHLSPQDTMNFPAFMGRHGDAQAGIDMITETYQSLTDVRYPGSGYVVDKSLNLNRLFGIWAKAVPQGKAIYIRRKPEHIAWSCYKTAFRGGADWSWSKESIQTYIENEISLLTHWEKCFPDRILTISYEDLVTKTNNVMNRVYEHIGLEPEKSSYSPKGSRNPVLTSSLGQVSADVNDESIKRAKAAEPIFNTVF